MMIGSLLMNCWGGLIAFTITFLVMLGRSIFPEKILFTATIVSIVTFFAMFLIRFLIGYILYTPDGEEDEHPSQLGSEPLQDELTTERNHTSTVEFEDESSEDIAKVVRTMLNQDDSDI